MTLNLMLFVLNLTKLILKSKLTSIFHNYSSYDTNILAHVPARCLFSRANACKGYMDWEFCSCKGAGLMFMWLWNQAPLRCCYSWLTIINIFIYDTIIKSNFTPRIFMRLWLLTGTLKEYTSIGSTYSSNN